MGSSPDQAETSIEALAQQIDELRRRVAALESRELQGSARTVVPALESALGEAAGLGLDGRWLSAESVGFAGRTLVILGGAFLIRAVSAAALLPDVTGPLVGLVYAAWWLLRADRDSSPASSTSPFFYGVAGVGIAAPLIWETTARFHLLPDVVAAPALVLFFALGLAVAWRREMRGLAWIALAATIVAAIGLLPSTHAFVLCTGALLAVAATIDAFGASEKWPELGWAAAAAIDATLLVVALLVTQPRMPADLAASLPVAGVVAVSLLAPAIDLARVARATLGRLRRISGADLLQLSASMVCGIGTALLAIRFRGGDAEPLAMGIAALGAVCYVVAFRSMDVAEHPRRNFHAYSSFAGLLVAVGTVVLLEPTPLAATWLVLAWAGVLVGVRFSRNTLRVHGALYLAAAAVASGLAAMVVHGVVGAVESLTPPLPVAAAFVAASSLPLYTVLARSRSAEDAHWSERIPRGIVATVAVLAVAGLGAPLLTAALVAALPNLDAVAFLASMRTCLLSVLAVLLAFAARRWSLADLGWLVYPLMAATGARLLWEDVSLGAPVNLFLALGFYGGAMIAVSRLSRHSR